AVWLLWGLAAVGSTAGLLSAWMPVAVIALGVLLLLAVTLFGVFLGRVPAVETSWAAPIRSERIRKLIPALRAGITLAMDVVLASVALLCAFLVRWEKAFPGGPERQLFYALPILCVCHAIACVASRSAHCGWRWFGLADLWRLSKCVASGCVLFTFSLWFLGDRGFSRGVVLLYAVFALCFAAGMRLLMRVLPLLAVAGSVQERAAILGASEAAELAILICQKRGVSARPVVVLESDPAANHITMRGVPVRSANGDPLRVLREARADMLIVPSGPELLRANRDIVEQCRIGGVRIVRLEVSMTPCAMVGS
ncbi:MAG: nucleoside-diphosphate sugar epimerase/dehydratase, partial [Bryobacteraceae bacterium]